MPVIGFLGPRGTFSQEAMLEYTKGREGYRSIDFNSISDLLLAVQSGELDEAIVPIENSLEGAVNVTLDMIAFDVDVKIKAEVAIPIRQNLLIKKGTDATAINLILSHPQPVGQCRKYINARFPEADVRTEYSTAGAAEEVARRGANCAAIASIAAAEVYGLDVLDSDIQDGNNNFTRFVVVCGKHSERTGDDKTSIVFSTDNKPGSLYRILDIFNLWDINMLRIESRPAKNQLGKYIFFIDICGHCDDPDVRDALIMIKRKTSFYKFLGSYPKHELAANN